MKKEKKRKEKFHSRLCRNLNKPPSDEPNFPSTMAFSEYRPLDEKSLIEYIKAVPALSSKLGNNLDDIKIKEVGDGNLNFVYIVVGPAGSFVIKQVLIFLFFEKV
jgi:hypothetical protein